MTRRWERVTRAVGWASVSVVVFLATNNPLSGQQVRGWVGSSAQVVGLRPYQTTQDGCEEAGGCLLPGNTELAAVVTHDLSLTGWGFGVRGLSATVQLRGRERLGGAFAWPRTDDHFDAILGYAELVRGDFTARAGRQEIRSGLGFPSFDGGLVRWNRRDVRVEAYGGRSLARGLRDPANEALRGLEDFLPDQAVYLIGGAVRGRVQNASLTARYHREILADRSGLASERASLGLSTTLPGASFRGSIDYDVANRGFGKGELTVGVPILDARWMVEAGISRYVPYFSLSTIWGLFEPVSYSEATLRVGWSPTPEWTARTSLGYRTYGDTGTPVVLDPLEDHGRRVSVDLSWRPRPEWSATTAYQLEWGPGGFLSALDTSLRWVPAGDWFVSVSGRSFQQIEEFRVGDGRAVGGGVSAGGRLAERVTVSGGFSLLRSRTEGLASVSPWNQARAWSSVRLLLGGDPGLSRLQGARR